MKQGKAKVFYWRDLVRLSVGIVSNVFVLTPLTILSFIALALIFSTSIEFVILGNFVPYSVVETIFFSNPIRSPKFVPLKSSQYSSSVKEISTLYYMDTDEIPRFLLLLKNHIFIARSEDTIYLSRVRILVSPRLLT